MNLQSQRIASACAQLGLVTTATHWSDLAKQHLEKDGTYAQGKRMNQDCSNPMTLNR